MNLIRVILKTAIAFFLLFILSCEKDSDIQHSDAHSIDTIAIPGTQNFLFNIPIHQGTFLFDKDYNIDFRIAIEGHIIDSAFLFIDNNYVIKQDTFIISTKSLYLSEGSHYISFLIRSVKPENGDTVFFKSKSLLFNVVENLSNRFVYPAADVGRLKLTWSEFDTNNTQRYIVERWLIDDKFNTMPREKKYHQTFEVQEASFIDNYYVGEEAEYKITIINNDGNKQDIWYYKKSIETPVYYVSQHSSGGYCLHFTKCKYFNNFGQYYLTDGLNANPTFIQSTNQVNDTALIIADAKFGGEERYWLRYLPKQLPNDFLEDDWNIYGKFIYTRFGDISFEYERIAIINNEYFAITLNGNIYKVNIESNQITHSIINESAQYGFLMTTPAGDYLYATDENLYGSPLYFWSTNDMPTQPNHTFQDNFIIPPVSDNLIAIMSVPSNVSPSKLALYNVTNGNIIFTTDYNGTSNRPKISSNGRYFFIYDSDLKLCNYENNTFKLIWEESDWTKYYRFYDFSPLSNDVCYTWDDDKQFSIRNTFDFSKINSFTLELERIINIDYYNKKIMGYVTDKILIYNLEDGTLENEIPANLRDLILYNNSTILIGNTIYNNNGIKYTIK